MEALSDSPFDPASPAILSFLGVTYYLSRETLAASARSIAAGVAPGSRLVLDYMLDEASAWPEHRAMRAQLEDVRGKARGAHEERIQPGRDERTAG